MRTIDHLLKAQNELAIAKSAGLPERDEKELNYMLTVIPHIIARVEKREREREKRMMKMQMDWTHP